MNKGLWLSLTLLLLITGCGRRPMFNYADPSFESKTHKKLVSLPELEEKIVVSVYGFRDQTGQYKPSEGTTSFSTAVSQGGTSILTKALADSGCYIVVEREKYQNLQLERKIIQEDALKYRAMIGDQINSLRREISNSDVSEEEKKAIKQRKELDLQKKVELLAQLKENFDEIVLSPVISKVNDLKKEVASGDLVEKRKKLRDLEQKFNSVGSLPSLLSAGVLIEGGVISYDTDYVTGGAGARYLGIGTHTQTRRDLVTVYLRLVSVRNGQILENVQVSKSILSREVNVGLYRYVNAIDILELEAGYSTNKPPSICVLEAIEEAVIVLTQKGVEKGLWKLKNPENVILEN